MPFTSPLFVVFILGFLPAFWLIEARSRKAALMFTAFASLAFVAINFPLFAIIPVAQGALIFAFQRSQRHATALWIVVPLLLAPLLLFKYFDFIAEQFGYPPLGLSLPLGISFYTFTAIGFVVDLYQKRYDIDQPGLLDNINLLTFWPHLASGPILRGDNFFFGKDKGHLLQRDISTALILIVFGLYKKIVIADGVGGLVNQNLETAVPFMGTEAAVATAVGFTIQLYGDFSGYSDMAIGFAILMGIYIPANFNYPYAATSLTDFWRRWHISLSTWFRDYLYIPLGGNQRGFLAGTMIIMIVFLVSGLWHGAAWHFVVWGGIHGVVLICERYGRKLGLSVPPLIGWLFTFAVVTLAFSFFFLPVSDALALLGRIGSEPTVPLPWNTTGIWFYAGLLAIDTLLRPYTVNKGKISGTRAGLLLSPLALAACFYFAGKPLPFIYFDF